jgi:hypothetical protein
VDSGEEDQWRRIRVHCRFFRTLTWTADLFGLRLPLRVAIELLSGRVVQLSRHASDNGLHPPPMLPDKSITIRKILRSLGLHDAAKEISGTTVDPKEHPHSSFLPSIRETNAEVQLSPKDSVSASAGNLAQSSPGEDNINRDNSFESDLRFWDSYQTVEDLTTIPELGDTSLESLDTVLLPGTTVDNPGHGPEAQPSGDIAGYDYTGGDGSEECSSNESLVDELSHRVGTLTIGPDGRTKLHGPSSILSVGQAQAQGGSDRFVNCSRHAIDHSKGLQDRSRVPGDLEDHLVTLFFDWVNPFSDFVDREIYTLAKAQYDMGEDTAYFSQALRNAM